MMKCNPLPLTANSAKNLKAKQKKVNLKRSRRTRYLEAKRLFALKNSAAFREIRTRLEAAAPSGDSCVYCERDRHRDLEHIFPQRHFPELAFNWENYVLACSICNQDSKNDTIGIIDPAGMLLEFNRSTLDFDTPLPPGRAALIDPRTEDPLEFISLDLDTGVLLPRLIDAVSILRAEFTIRLFDLNSDAFLRIRRAQCDSFLQYYEKYIVHSDAGDVAGADHFVQEIRQLPHPTVWAELKRQGHVTRL